MLSISLALSSEEIPADTKTSPHFDEVFHNLHILHDKLSINTDRALVKVISGVVNMVDYHWHRCCGGGLASLGDAHFMAPLDIFLILALLGMI